MFPKQAANSLVTETLQYFVLFCRYDYHAILAKCLIINDLRLIRTILFFIAFLNITYTARHTWATLAKYCQVPEEVISEGLGHSSLEVTRTYLKSFEGDELDKANRLIINYIYSGIKTLWNRS